MLLLRPCGLQPSPLAHHRRAGRAQTDPCRARPRDCQGAQLGISPSRLDLACIAPSGGVGRGVSGPAVGAGVQKAGALVSAHLAHQALRHLIDLDHIISVDGNCRHTQRLSPGARPRPRGHSRGHCKSGNPVVFADEHHRQPVQRRPVETFEKRAAIDRAVAEQAHGDGVRLQQLQALRRTDRDRDAAGDDAICTQHSDGEVGDVH